MSNRENLPAVTVDDDGFARDFSEEAGRFPLIEGDRLAFKEARWLHRDDSEVPPDTRLMALKSKSAIRRWKNQKLVEAFVETATKPLPDINALNAKVPRKEWEKGLNGQPREPYERCEVVYLFDPDSAEEFTFVTPSLGGRIAVRELCKQVSNKRTLTGKNLFPIVRLSTKPMSTKYGPRQRPHFEVVGWDTLGFESSTDSQIEHDEQEPRGKKSGKPAPDYDDEEDDPNDDPPWK
jgi:hypothetical protein